MNQFTAGQNARAPLRWPCTSLASNTFAVAKHKLCFRTLARSLRVPPAGDRHTAHTSNMQPCHAVLDALCALPDSGICTIEDDPLVAPNV